MVTKGVQCRPGDWEGYDPKEFDEDVPQSLVTLPPMPDHLMQRVINELKRGFNRDVTTALVDQHKAALAAKTFGKHRAIDGLGAVKCRISPALYHAFGAKYGYECWQDDDFVNSVIRRNPEVRVESGGTHEIYSGWQPPANKTEKTVVTTISGVNGKSRFTKTYADSPA